MKTRLLIMLAIGISGLLVPPAFSITEELIHGSSSIELFPSEIIPGKPTSFEIKFQYTEGPYALDNFIPVIEVSPASAKQYITIDVNSTGVTNRQILRIPATLMVDPQIEHEKIFLSISFSGNHFSSRSDAIYKSDWSESVILNISPKKLLSTELPSSQDYEFESLSGARCDEKPSVCYGTFPNGTKIQIQCDYVRHGCGPISFDDSEKFYLSPLKQFKMGIKFLEIQCKGGLELVAKMPSAHPKCVKPESVEKLTMRGWATTNKTVELTNPTKYMVEKNGIPFEIQYSLKGATLDGIVHDVDANSIRVALDNSAGGQMVISIPRELIDAKIGKGGIDDLFFLLIDGEENMYGEKTNEIERTITIWFPKDASEIEIIGVSWT